MVDGKYRVDAPLGRGGMGKVFKAHQEPGGRPIALKVLSPKYSADDDPNFAERFMLEASAAAKLQHPNNITIYDFGTDGELVYIAMELLEGRTLSRLLKMAGALPVDRAVHIAEQTARALREAHQLGIVHRDIKPSNVILIERDDDPDFVKVLDFGLVKFVDQDTDLTKSGMFVGSPKYMPPEQIRKSKGGADARIDIYSLGVLMFHMLVGQIPYDGEDSVDILMAHLNDPIPPVVREDDVEIPERLRQLVRRCMAKEPEDRPQSIDEVISELRAVRGAEDSGSGTSASVSGGSSGSNIPVVTAAAVDPPATRGLRWVLPLGVALIAGVALMFVVAGSGGEGVEGEVPATGRTAAAALSAGGDPRVPGARRAGGSLPVAIGAREVTVRVDSAPPGAEVFSDGSSLGYTPLVEIWEMTDEARTREHTFEVRLDGYRSETVTVRVADGMLKASVTLSRKGGKGDRPKGDPGSYKGDPY